MFADATKHLGKFWDIDISEDSFNNFMKDQFAKCLERHHTSNKRTKRRMSLFSSMTYNYLLWYKEKPLTKTSKKNLENRWGNIDNITNDGVRDKYTNEIRSFKNTANKLLSLLDDRYTGQSKQTNLILLLEDLADKPLEYMRIPKHPSVNYPKTRLEKEIMGTMRENIFYKVDPITREIIKDHPFNKEVCVNEAKRIAKEIVALSKQ